MAKLDIKRARKLAESAPLGHWTNDGDAELLFEMVEALEDNTNTLATQAARIEELTREWDRLNDILYTRPTGNAAMREHTRTKRMEAAEARATALEDALRRMVYETTHLSAEEDDGSHWCKIPKDALTVARAALQKREQGDE